MPADFERCVKDVMKQGKSKSSAYAICTAQFKKAGKKFRDSADKLLFEYAVPISENFLDNSDFVIKGIAINETTTSNGHKFVAEELKKAANTLVGVPLLKDHNNSVDAIIGRVKGASFDESLKNIPFVAKVNDKTVQELIKRGDLNTVSIGAAVNPRDIEELDDGTIIPRNIVFKELSLVAVPADPGATFQVALSEAFKGLKESYSSHDEIEVEGGLEMAEEETKLPEEEESKEEPEVEESVDLKKVLARLDKLEKEAVGLKTENADLRKKYADELAKANAKEADVDEQPKESEESKEPEEEEDDEVEEASEYKFIEGTGSLKGNSVTLIRNKY